MGTSGAPAQGEQAIPPGGLVACPVAPSRTLVLAARQGRAPAEAREEVPAQCEASGSLLLGSSTGLLAIGACT